jgi:predicted O-methyltransferase YrrM|tara:strand:- start:337 stop:1014 length:678 start_codon:yes stop_codon:yes gene_type:complete
MKKISSSEIKNTLDKWVSGVGTGRYSPSDYVDDLDNSLSLSENFGIQQVKTEIYKFIDVLLKQQKLNNCLEIGLGFYGSTHFLWRLIFEKTITIENQKDRVSKFRENMNKFYNKFTFNDLKSSFVFGLSHDTSSVEKVDKLLNGKKLDLLFIDGDHNYKSVLCDWLLYKNYVAKGGIIAFHDCIASDDGFGVPKLLKKIKSFDSDIKLQSIIDSKNFGIAYYYNK